MPYHRFDYISRQTNDVCITYIEGICSANDVTQTLFLAMCCSGSINT